MPIKNSNFVLRPSKLPNYYAVLGVPPTASSAQLKDAYYNASWANHPDCGGRTERMAEITEAYAVLRDPAKRKAYDAKRRLLCKPCGTCRGEGVVYKQKGFTRRVSSPCAACSGTGQQERVQ